MKNKKLSRRLRFLVQASLLVLIAVNLVLMGLSLFTKKTQESIHSLSEDIPLEAEEPAETPVTVPIPTAPPATPTPTPTPTPEPPFQEMDGYVAVSTGSIYNNPQLAGDPIRHIVIRARVHVSARSGDAFAIEVTEKSVPEFGVKGYMAIKEVVFDLNDISYGQQEDDTPNTSETAGNDNGLGYGADPIPTPEE